MAIETQETQKRTLPPESFVKQVKGTLEHLYDFAYLECHPLAQDLSSATEQPNQTAGQRLRRDLLAAIETLNPGTDVPFRAPHARLYNLLHLHYVEGGTIQEAAHELGLSLRQAYRDLRRGEESVAAVLWAQRSASPGQNRNAAWLSSVQVEMSRLETHPRPIDLRPLLQHAQGAVARLAQQHAINFDLEVPPKPLVVSADPVIAQQVLINALSHAVQQSLPGTVYLTLTSTENYVSLTLRYALSPGADHLPVISEVVAQLLDRLKWKIRQEDQPDNVRIVTLHMATRGPIILVIDDNEGLVQLLDRYLTGHACRVIAATGGNEGLRLAWKLTPDAIVLDVMMPEMDGWEFLQRLRARPQTATAPVIICSVINDPDLAYSLGASLFLPKPVSRDEVLSALHQLGVV